MGKRIVVIEDDPKSLRLLRALLIKEGFTVLAASDGIQGVRLVRENLPDLILLDIQLPALSGLDATRVLKQDHLTSHIPIIAITALAMKGDREQIMEAGCDAYMSKPIKISEVLAEIARFLDRGQGALS